MTTRISVTEPSRLLEASRALQAANQRRLQDRTEDGWMQRDATRLVKRGRGFADSLISRAAGQRDPWRGAVPEFEEPEFFPVQLRGKRFQVAGAWFRFTGSSNPLTLTVSTQRIGQSAAAEVAIPYTSDGGLYYFALPAGRDRMVLYFREANINDVLRPKAFVVTKSAVQQVDVPIGLQELVSKITEVSFIEEEFGDSFQVGPNVFRPEPYAPFPFPDFYYMLIQGYGFGQLVNRAPYTIGDVRRLIGTPPNLEFDPASVARGNSIQNRNWGWTPSFLAYLKNYDGRFHGYISDPESQPNELQRNILNYKYVRDTFFPLDAPPYMLTSGYQEPGKTIDTTLKYYYFRSPADEGASVINPSAFSSLTGSVRPKPTIPRNQSAELPVETLALLNAIGYRNANYYSDLLFSGTPVFTWDWDRPLACLIELQRLGFTASDLMLTPEETAALAAADPAVVGFKF